MNKIIVAGSGTDVGKTVVCAILTTLFEGNYWKPIQCGNEEESDSSTMKTLIDARNHQIYPSAYSLKAPFSPHHAARLENITIDIQTIIPPLSNKTLIIETVGGISVPINTTTLTIDLFKTWNYPWIIVSRHYIGSINHTLLTLEVLNKREIPILGVIFNGEPNPDSEEAILRVSKVPFLGRLLQEPSINSQIIQRYAKEWKPLLSSLIR